MVVVERKSLKNVIVLKIPRNVILFISEVPMFYMPEKKSFLYEKHEYVV